MTKDRIYSMSFASVYPHYVAKAEKKGRTKAEIDEIIRWLTATPRSGWTPSWGRKPAWRSQLKALGWETETEVAVTKLLGKGFEGDFGDVDVLAWRAESGRVLLIGCKDVQFRKTEGEIAEQLSDFRGLTRPDGKPNLLLKHLDRIDLIAKERAALERYLKWDKSAEIEGHLVFKNMVPMEYAWEHMKERIALHVFDDLDKL